MNISTNALIAALRALTSESKQLEAKLQDGELSDEDAEELGVYANDLQEALSSLSDAYEIRSQSDTSLTDIDTLLKHFAASML